MLALILTLTQQEHAARGPLAVEPGLMIWTVVVFLLLLLVLRKFAWPALLNAVEAREKALEDMVARTDQPYAPWDLIAAESKRFARVEVLRTVIARIEEGRPNAADADSQWT